MKTDKDVIIFGMLDRSLTDPLRNELLKIDFNSDRFSRSEIPLIDGKLVEFPFMIQNIKHPQKESEKLIASAQPIIEHIKKIFPEHSFVRGEIAILLPKTKIKPHIDRRWFHANCRRVHVPIITNSDSFHLFEDRTAQLKEDELVEINNRIIHSAVNNADTARIHCIFDIIPTAKLVKAIEDKVNISEICP